MVLHRSFTMDIHKAFPKWLQTLAVAKATAITRHVKLQQFNNHLLHMLKASCSPASCYFCQLFVSTPLQDCRHCS